MAWLSMLATDAQLSGEWVLALIAKIFAGLGLLAGAVVTAVKHGAKKERQRQQGDVTIKHPVPTVPTQKIYGPPTWDQHVALSDRVKRVEIDQEKLRDTQTKQFKELLGAGGEREIRLSEKLDVIARGIHERIDRIKDDKK